MSMSLTRRRWMWAGIAFVLIGLLVAGFFAAFHQVPVDVPVPPGREARANPMHALTLALRKAGHSVVLKGHLDLQRDPPPARGTIVLPYPEAQIETSDDAANLLAWVEGGGFLVLPMPRAASAPALDEFLHGGLGVFPDWGSSDTDDEASAACAMLRLPQAKTFEICGVPFSVEEANAFASWPTGARPKHAARLSVGDGEVLLLSTLEPLQNAALAEPENASFAAALMAPALNGDAVWMVVYRGGSLTALLWREGWPALLGLGLALIAWLAWRTQRIGPLIPSPAGNRRALTEHIDAAGQYAFRNDHGRALHAATRAAVIERLSRRHAMAGLDEAALAQALADRCALPLSEVREALALPPRAPPERFRAAIALLSKLLHRP